MSLWTSAISQFQFSKGVLGLNCLSAMMSLWTIPYTEELRDVVALSQLPFGNDVSLDSPECARRTRSRPRRSQLPFGNDVSLDDLLKSHSVSQCLLTSQLPFGNDVSLDTSTTTRALASRRGSASQLPFGNDVSLDNLKDGRTDQDGPGVSIAFRQ